MTPVVVAQSEALAVLADVAPRVARIAVEVFLAILAVGFGISSASRGSPAS